MPGTELLDVRPLSQVGASLQDLVPFKGMCGPFAPSRPCFAFCHEMIQQQGLCKIRSLQPWMSQLPAPKDRPFLLIINELEAGGVAQMIQCLPTSHEVLGLILSNPKHGRHCHVSMSPDLRRQR